MRGVAESALMGNVRVLERYARCESRLSCYLDARWRFGTRETDEILIN